MSPAGRLERPGLAVVLLGLATSAAAATEVAPSAEQVEPRLIGAEAPAVELAAPDGTPVDLGALFARKPTIVILYRGGW